MAPQTQKMRTVRLPVTVQSGGKSYPPGTPVSLPSDDAEAYIARWGEAKEAPPAKPDPRDERIAALEAELAERTDKVAELEAKVAALGEPSMTLRPEAVEVAGAAAAAIGKLDPKNGAHFTKAGVPRVKAVEQILGYDITEEERDEAWALAKKG